MNPSPTTSDFTRWMGTALAEVVDTLFGWTVAHATQIPSASTTPPLVAEVALLGETAQGWMRLLLPEAFVRAAADVLLGPSEADPRSEVQLRDLAGEVVNMVAGRLAAELRRIGLPCTLGTPSVGRDRAPATPEPTLAGDWLCHGFPLRLEFRFPHSPA